MGKKSKRQRVAAKRRQEEGVTPESVSHKKANVAVATAAAAIAQAKKKKAPGAVVAVDLSHNNANQQQKGKPQQKEKQEQQTKTATTTSSKAKSVAAQSATQKKKTTGTSTTTAAAASAKSNQNQNQNQNQNKKKKDTNIAVGGKMQHDHGKHQEPTPQDHDFMLRAVNLSRKHMLVGAGGPFGAVIVKDGKVIGEGWNKVTSGHDPTAHGEMTAIRNACAQAGSFEACKGTTMYTSCEPCPMCLGGIYWARIDRVVFSNTRHDAKMIGFDDAFIYEEIPKNIDGRSIKFAHLPLNEASEVFQLWASKHDRTEY